MADAWWLKDYAKEMRWHGDDLSNQINWYAQQLYNQQNPQAQELAKTLFGNVNNLSGMSADMTKQMQGFLGYDNPLTKIGQYLNTAGQSQRDTGRGVYRDAQQLGNQYYNDAVNAGNQVYGEGLRLGQDAYRSATNTGADMFAQNRAIGDAGYAKGLELGDKGLAMMQGLADKALNGQGMPTAAGFERGSTKAGQYADQMMSDYNTMFRPAQAKALNDAMNFNSQAYREGLSQQTAAEHARQMANANQQMTRDLAARGIGAGSGAALKMRNQNALAAAAGRANAITAGNMAAQDKGRSVLSDAMSSTAGSHLLQAANQALGTQASVTNANTAASASVANALMDAQNRYRDTSLSTAYNALNASLGNQAQTYQTGLGNQTQAYKTGTDAMMTGQQIGANALANMYGDAANAKTSALNAGMDAATALFGTGAQGLMKGGDQWLEALKAQGLLQSEAGKIGVDMGKLGIDAAAGANNSALTGMQIGAYPTNQLIQNLLAGFGPRQWGMESIFNAENIHKGLSTADDGRHGALMGQIIGAVGSMFGGPFGSMLGSAIGGGLGGGGGGAYSYQGTRW